MSQNEAAEDYIFPTGKVAPIDVSRIDLDLKVPPLRSVSTNSAENKEHIYEEINDDYASKYYDSPIAPSNNIYEPIKPSFFKNRKKIIIFSSILIVVAIVAIIAVIMIVLATASKRH